MLHYKLTAIVGVTLENVAAPLAGFEVRVFFLESSFARLASASALFRSFRHRCRRSNPPDHW